MAEEQTLVDAFTRHVDGWTPQQRAKVLRARPDVVPEQVRGDAEALARRLVTASGLAAAGTTLPLGPTQVLVAALLVGGVTRQRLADLLGTDTEVLAPHLERLLERALLWDDGDVVRPVPGLRRTLQPPVQLGPTAEEAAERLTGAQVDTALRRLGQRAPAPAKRATSLAALCAALCDEDVVRRVADSAPSVVRRSLAGRFAQVQRAQEPAAVTSAHLLAEEQAVRWAEKHGLAFQGIRYGSGYQTFAASPYDIFAFGPQLPREVVVALRPEGAVLPFTPVRPPVGVHPVTPEAVADGSAAALAELTAVTTALVDELERAPLPLLRTGGVGVREVRRLAKLLGADEVAVRFALDLAGLMGLLVGDDGLDLAEGRFLGRTNDAAHVSDQGAAWRDLEPAGRAVALAAAWLHAPGHLSEPDRSGKPRPPLVEVPGTCAQCTASRPALLSALAHLGPVEATSPVQIAAAAAWESPGAHPGHDAAGTPFGLAWREAERAGFIAEGALSPLGRLLLSGDAEGAESLLGQAMPPSVDTVLFGADLTAVVPGDPAASVSRLLDSCADREGRGGAVVWRLTPGSVRRALDGGTAADSLLERLESVGAGRGLPQPLTYLVRDVARTHGLLRVRPTASVLRCPDAPLLAQVCADRALRQLGLQLLAPTVATTDADPAEVLTALRAAGYLPMPEAPGAVVELPGGAPASSTAGTRERPPVRSGAMASRAATALTDRERVDGGARHLSARERQLLTDALVGGGPVVIDYVTVAGTRSQRTLTDLRLLDEQSGKASLTATSASEGERRTFRLDRITRVAAAGGD